MPEIEVAVAMPCPLWGTDFSGIAEKAARAALSRMHEEADQELSLVLADDAFVQDLNRGYRGKDQPTNVLSFPCGEEEEGGRILLGDVILAYETTCREAEEQSKSLPDHASHLIVHGVLHLFGYDHMEEAQAEAMEALETEILAHLGIADPY